ncbi:4'-phosphopantetheinyl transferase family protein [Micromonospora tarensis]|uniref:4'-phosphopantetheinyl transferase family protein n=1 Tax=Micromonospora tarensis TaxID=2806100 RepID=UPI0028164D42|nr:4'-phosphopantetheinyl transferase superfamily protein [Micromonospora tarensis]
MPVQLWWAGPESADESLLALLDPAEVSRYGGYRVASARRHYLTGRALLRVALGRHLGLDPAAVPLRTSCPGCGGPHGRPRLVLPDRADEALPEVSVSHSGARVVVALALGAPVGVDVQQVDERLDLAALIPSTLAPAEATALSRLGEAAGPAAFTRIWTRKEAVLKALGVGLARPLPQLEVSPPDQPAAVLRWPDVDVPPRVTLLDVDAGTDHRASLAVFADAVDLSSHDGAALLARQPRR